MRVSQAKTKAVKWQIYTAANPTVTRIIPELAAEIGLNESIVLLQIAYWIGISDNIQDNVYWTYQSMTEMKEKAFPYWSVDTIRRIIHKLHKDGYILVGQYNKRKGDNTQWYAIEPDKLSTLKSILVVPSGNESNTPYLQVASMPPSQVASTPLQDRMTLPEITTESKEKDSTPVPDVSPFDAFIENELHIEPVVEKPKPATRPAKKQKEPDAYDLAIAKVWDNSASGFLTQVKGMMFGCGKKGSTWEDCNFNPPVNDPAEIERFGEYMARRMKMQDIRIRPTAAVVIQRWFYDFRTEEKRKAAVASKAAPVPEVSDPPEVTAQQRAALLDAMQTTRPAWEQVEVNRE